MPYPAWIREIFADDDKVAADYEAFQALFANYQRQSAIASGATEGHFISSAVAPTAEKSSDRGCVWVDGYDDRAPRMIAGIASTPTISRNSQSMLSRGCELAVPVPLRFGHVEHGGPIGEVVYMRKDENQIYIRAVIFDHEAGRYAWQKIERGELLGLSCGFRDEGEAFRLQAQVDGVKFYDRFKIKEVSIVHKPANPDCHFHIYSAGTVTQSLSADELDRFWSWYEQELRVRHGECDGTQGRCANLQACGSGAIGPASEPQGDR